MKKRLSFLVLPILIILCFSRSQNIHSMEKALLEDKQEQEKLLRMSEEKDPEERMNSFVPSSEATIAGDYAVMQQSACERIQPKPACFMDIPNAILHNILFSLSMRNAFNLRGICKRFFYLLSDKEIEKYFVGFSIPENAEAAYKRFIMSVVSYISPKGDVISLRVAELAKPLGGTFVLPHHEKTRHLTISTGYPKEENSQEISKVNIWFALRFLVEREINGSARHLRQILDEWDERYPIGMFVTYICSDNDRCYLAYLVNETMDQLSEGDLRLKYRKCKWQGSVIVHGYDYVLEGVYIYFPKDRRVSKDSGKLTANRIARVMKEFAHAVLQALPS